MKNDFDCWRRCGVIFRNKCCILCLVLFILLISLVIAAKVYINAVLSHIEENSYNSTFLSGEASDPTETVLEFIQVPQEITREFPHTFSGFDYENRPVWIVKFGNWDVKRLLNENEENDKWLRIYLDQQIERAVESLKIRNSSHLCGIMDFEGYSYGQLVSAKTVAFELQLLKKLEDFFRKVAYGYAVNLDFFAESMVGIASPILGDFMDRVEIYGKNTEKYFPAILKRIPSDQLPAEYGGSKGHKSIQVFR